MRILFCGPGYGAGNIGDDAILAGALRIARGHLPKDTKYGAIVYTEYFDAKRSDTDVVFLYPGDIVPAFEWATHIVLGGATLLGNWGVPRCARLIKLANALDKPICMLGVGVSDALTADNLRHIKDVFSSLSLITVRSDEDRRIALSYGLASDVVKVSADLAFAATYGQPQEVSKSSLGINLVDEHLPKNYAYLEHMKRFLSEYPTKYKLNFVCGEARRNLYFDYEMLHQLHTQFGGALISEHFEYRDFVRLLSSYALVFTMRMHMVIFCAVAGVPCLPLIREKKTELMARSLGLTNMLHLNDAYGTFALTFADCLSLPKSALANADYVRTLKSDAYQINGRLLESWCKDV